MTPSASAADFTKADFGLGAATKPVDFGKAEPAAEAKRPDGAKGAAAAALPTRFYALLPALTASPCRTAPVETTKPAVSKTVGALRLTWARREWLRAAR